MNTEEITQEGLGLGTGEILNELNQKVTILGDRILIKLDEAQDHTVTESGIAIPLNEVYETDGGRLKTRTSDRKHLAQGTVLAIGDQAVENLAKLNIILGKKDKVFLSHTALNQKAFYFFTRRDKLVQDFDGLIAIPHTLIEAKYNEFK